MRFAGPDDRPVGEVLWSSGQLCLVALAEKRAPLGERLRERHPEMADAIRAALARAKSTRRPLGEALAELGAAPSEVVKDVLLDQFAEGLAALAGLSRGHLHEEAMSMHPERLAVSLSAFPALAVYWRTVPHVVPAAADVASRCFDELAPEAERAALIAYGPETGGAPLPVATRGFTPASVAELARLGRFVETIARPPALDLAGDVPTLVHLDRSDDGALGIAGPSHCALLVGVRPRVRAQAIRCLG
jgi:hypothetical protein